MTNKTTMMIDCAKNVAFGFLLTTIVQVVSAQEVPPIDVLIEAAQNDEEYPIPREVTSINEIRERLREACLANELCRIRLEADTYYAFDLIPPYNPDAALTTVEMRTGGARSE